MTLSKCLLYREVGDKKVIVFANTKANCELVSQTLYAKGYSCTVLHSGKSQVPMHTPDLLMSTSLTNIVEKQQVPVSHSAV